MQPIISKIDSPNPNQLLYSEWLVTNGLGGYACGSLSGAPMRKYHSLLIAALPVPYGRIVMLNYVADVMILSDQRAIPLSLIRQTNDEGIPTFALVEFRLENGLPYWRYKFENFVLEKCLFLVHHQNTVHIRYTLLEGTSSIKIKWRPYFHFRGYESAVNVQNLNEEYIVHAHEKYYEIEYDPFPILRLFNDQQSTFTRETNSISNVFYEISARRGYESVGGLKSPGYFLSSINLKDTVTFIASTESWQTITALTPNEALFAETKRHINLLENARELSTSETAAKMVLASDQFIITPFTRHQDLIRLEAIGEEAQSIIAGYPWFTDWGRDTMISLEGLTLTTKRFNVANSILRTFAYYIKDGLIPNMFPDGIRNIFYNTADATLWFFHAVDKYIQAVGNQDILDFLLPKLKEIVNCHIKGTHFGIKMDKDGLLTQGQEGVQLTWMDAKVGPWVVTPRRGKAVEINALWYNALKLLERWTNQSFELSTICYNSFNKRFWFESGKYLYDIVDGENGDDPAMRPNQLFAISLEYPVLQQNRWEDVLKNVQKELLTPYGLRTLSPSHPDFKGTYDGDLRARDAAYHQGTVWPWLLGAFIDAWCKIYPNDLNAPREFLKGLETHIDQHCLGTIGEIFDAYEPYHARGCFAQAWSVAEFLRSYVKVYPELKTK